MSTNLDKTRITNENMDELNEEVDASEFEPDEAVSEDEGDAASEEEQVESDESTDSEDDDSDDDAEDTSILKERLRVAQEKLDRKTHELERAKKEKKEAPKASSPEDMDVVRLEARGFLNEDEQNLIIRAAKLDGISVIEAAKDDMVLEKIERMRKVKKAERSVDRPTSGSPSVKKDVDYYIRTGKMPTDPVLIAARADRLAEMSRKSR